MQYSSKDFALTAPELKAVALPEPLVHRDVRRKFHDTFSMERGHGVAVVDVPSKTISMTLGHLHPEQRTRKHRHNYETILYILKGSGHSFIENQKVDWQNGDAVYVPVWAWHQHVNSGPGEVEYLACENAPLLQNLGNIALREEAPIHERENI
jgi:gentisate 1,2-dioxygenase